MTIQENGIDSAEIEMMAALLQFKKKHGAPAYLALLSKFNAERWNQIPATAHGAVVVQCKAGVAGLDIDDTSNDADEDDTPSIRDRLNDLAREKYGTADANNDFAIIAAGAPDLKTAFDLYARAVHARTPK